VSRLNGKLGNRLNGSLFIAVPIRGLRAFTIYDFWRVSADTKTCGSPLICHFYGDLYFNIFSKKNQQKNGWLLLPEAQHEKHTVLRRHGVKKIKISIEP
jgi:hypothetical protein